MSIEQSQGGAIFQKVGYLNEILFHVLLDINKLLSQKIEYLQHYIHLVRHGYPCIEARTVKY